MPDLKNLPGSHDFRPGLRRISAQDLNDLRESAIRQITGAPPILVNKFGNRVNIELDVNSIIPTPILATFAVLSQASDWLLCAPYVFVEASPYNVEAGVGIAENQQIFVAKPYLLQQTPWHEQTIGVAGRNVTYTYSAALGVRTLSFEDEDSETQVIHTPYFPGDIIVARLGPTGYAIATGDEDEAIPIFWTDINEGGRHWMPAQLVSDVVCDPTFSKTVVRMD